ncbi:MAG: wax ester/triacylglycerol synthase family O-acyltransferase [Gammaproteobacteria bacterium]|nr:wax ester/triacylglycerol synthase family O-acyltransferase [Gammaproteobacteria bacterium]
MSNKMIPPLDLMFFLTETAQSPKHVGAVQVFELPANAPDSYLVDLVSAFKQAPVAPPFNNRPHFPRFGMPQWREDEDLEIDYHVRHSALPKPGSTQQLMDVVQRLHATLLDRRRPGWICQVIEGLEGNRFAIYSKIHHAYIDGKSGTQRMYGSLSTSPTSKAVIPSWSFQPQRASREKPGIGAKAKAGDKLGRQVKGVIEAYEFLSRMGMQWLQLRDSKAQIPFNATRTRMNRSIEWDTRSAAICTLPLDKVKAVGKARGCTVNEVVLAVIGAALHDYLEEHRENTRAPLVALCPMSIRAEGDDSAKTQVSAVHVRLGEPNAAIGERLDQVIESSHASKDEVQGLSNEAMIDYGVIIFALWELLSRTRLDQVIKPSYNVLVSNVPGPGEKDLYLNGSRMLASYPISTLLPGVNLNATLLSHGNSLDFGLLGDMHALPDLEIVVQQMVLRFEELQRVVLGKTRAAASRKKTAKPKRRSSTRAGSAAGKKATAGARPRRKAG